MFSANSSQVSEDRLYVEDVFSTYLYTGNGGTQTITNGIDLAGKGGMVWTKTRNQAYSHIIYDTNRGVNKLLFPNQTDAQLSSTNFLNSFNSNGFTIGSNENTNFSTSNTGASWTFREAPKFFDVVTYTGNGSSPRDIAHSLGVAPGAIIIKRTDASGDNWVVYHRSVDVTNSGGPNVLLLNLTNAVSGPNGTFAYTVPTATTFKVGSNANVSGATYVAYLFAHDTTSDGIIQCGSFTTDGSGNATVSLGWEPQWVLSKNATSAESWITVDTMRGWSQTNAQGLFPDLSNAEVSLGSGSPPYDTPTATGFNVKGRTASRTYIYVAIRRGPMRTPTSGTSVFAPTLTSSYGENNLITTGFPVDLCLGRVRANGYSTNAFDRLRGTAATSGRWLSTNTTDAEQTNGFYGVGLTSNTGFFSNWWTQDVGVQWNFRRAPSFFDVVCYTGNGVQGRSITHNLTVAPELMIVKCRDDITSWAVYAAPIGATNYLFLQTTSGASPSSTVWNDTTPTSSTFTVGAFSGVNTSAKTYVAYLFASCPGVSKVGSYTGNGSSQTINCGFAAGARFVMIKRTDSTGDWYVWDTARGIVAGNDPRLSLNSTAAEVTTDDSVDTDSSGFVVNQLSATNINVSSATYIYLAVA